MHYWNFVPCGNFSSVHVVNYVQSPDDPAHLRRTRSAERSQRGPPIVNDGIGLDRVERRSREKIHKVDIVGRDNPGEERLLRKDNRDRLEVYRPGPDELRKEGVVRGGSGSPGGNDARDQRDSRDGRYGQRSADDSKVTGRFGV